MTTKAKRKSTKKRGGKNGVTVDRSTFSKTPWDGSVDEDDLIRPGGALLAMLSARARQLGHTRGEMAKTIGVTYGYIAQLASGHRDAENISDVVMDACAAYLGVPKLTVMAAAGALKPQDLYERPDLIASALPGAMEQIRRDPEFGPHMPHEFISPDASPRTQFWVVQLYDAARRCKLIPGEHTPEQIAHSLKLIEDRRRQLLKQ